MPATMSIESTTNVVFSIEGKHAHLATPKDITYAINRAKEVFERNEADPLACYAAVEKMESDQLLTKEEALLCLVWDEAEEIAFKYATLGWLSRDVDIQLKVAPAA